MEGSEASHFPGGPDPGLILCQSHSLRSPPAHITEYSYITSNIKIFYDFKPEFTDHIIH